MVRDIPLILKVVIPRTIAIRLRGSSLPIKPTVIGPFKKTSIISNASGLACSRIRQNSDANFDMLSDTQPRTTEIGFLKDLPIIWILLEVPWQLLAYCAWCQVNFWSFYPDVVR